MHLNESRVAVVHVLDPALRFRQVLVQGLGFHGSLRSLVEFSQGFRSRGISRPVGPIWVHRAVHSLCKGLKKACQGLYG